MTLLMGSFVVKGALGLILSFPVYLSFQFKLYKERCSRNKGKSQLESQDNRRTDAVSVKLLQKSVGEPSVKCWVNPLFLVLEQRVMNLILPFKTTASFDPSFSQQCAP